MRHLLRNGQIEVAETLVLNVLHKLLTALQTMESLGLLHCDIKRKTMIESFVFVMFPMRMFCFS